jgi:hypothetical protein
MLVYDRALEFYNRSLEIAKLQQSQSDIADNLVEIGTILINRGSYIEALAYTYSAARIVLCSSRMF